MTAKELLKHEVDGLTEEDAALWLVRLRHQGPPGVRLTLADLAQFPVEIRRMLMTPDLLDVELSEFD